MACRMIEFNEPIDLWQVKYNYCNKDGNLVIGLGGEWLPKTTQVMKNDNLFARLIGRVPYAQTKVSPFGEFKRNYLTIPEAINYEKPEGYEFVKFSLEPQNLQIRIFYKKRL
jgi:hypothetical protein